MIVQDYLDVKHVVQENIKLDMERIMSRHVNCAQLESMVTILEHQYAHSVMPVHIKLGLVCQVVPGVNHACQENTR